MKLWRRLSEQLGDIEERMFGPTLRRLLAPRLGPVVPRWLRSYQASTPLEEEYVRRVRALAKARVRTIAQMHGILVSACSAAIAFLVALAAIRGGPVAAAMVTVVSVSACSVVSLASFALLKRIAGVRRRRWFRTVQRYADIRAPELCSSPSHAAAADLIAGVVSHTARRFRGIIRKGSIRLRISTSDADRSRGGFVIAASDSETLLVIPRQWLDCFAMLKRKKLDAQIEALGGKFRGMIAHELGHIAQGDPVSFWLIDTYSRWFWLAGFFFPMTFFILFVAVFVFAAASGAHPVLDPLTARSFLQFIVLPMSATFRGIRQETRPAITSSQIDSECCADLAVAAFEGADAATSLVAMLEDDERARQRTTLEQRMAQLDRIIDWRTRWIDRIQSWVSPWQERDGEIDVHFSAADRRNRLRDAWERANGGRA